MPDELYVVRKRPRKPDSPSVQQSEDWQLRDHIDPTMLNAVLDLQRRTLDAFSQVDAPTE